MLATAPTLKVPAFTLAERRRSRFGAVLHDIREEKYRQAKVSEARRYSVRGLAERAGLSASSISYLGPGIDPRTGQESRPRMDTIEMLAVALGDDEDEAKSIHDRLMEATGYVPRGRLNEAWAPDAKPPIPVLTRGITDNPEIPEVVQRKILELLERTEELNKALREEEE